MYETYIFNAKVIALFLQMLLKKTLACWGDKSHGSKVNKARVSALLAANLDGSEKALAPSYRQKQAAAVPSECTVACTELQIKHKSADDWGAS